MSRKQFVVCLLALAGSACLLLARRSGTQHGAAKLPGSIETRLGDPADTRSARSASGRAVPERFSPGESVPASSNPAAVSLPMAFEPNLGQADARVEFVGRGKGLTVLLMRDEIAVRTRGNNSVAIRFRESGDATRRRARGEESRIHELAWHGEEKLRGESNYFIGQDQRTWRSGVPHFGRAEAASVARGTGLTIYGNDEGVEYDLRIAPGADVSRLRVALDGAQNVRLDGAGDLVMRVGSDDLTMKKPVVYEERPRAWHASTRTRKRPRGSRSPRTKSSTRGRISRRVGANPARVRHRKSASDCGRSDGQGKVATRQRRDGPCPVAGVAARRGAGRKRLEAAYVLHADGSVGFRVGPHDASAELVVDPSLSVAYATFLGGSGADSAATLAVDASGKIYVGGATTSTVTFPEGSGARVGRADGTSELFVAKIDPTVSGANSLVYLTFLGGSGTQTGGLIAIDGSGDVAITGTTTSTDFPVTDASVPTSGVTSGYGNDVTVSELDPTGRLLVFSTLFGGSGAESKNGTGGIALDASGDVYIASDTLTTPVDAASADLPVTTSAFQTSWDGELDDGFVAIFQPPAQAGGAATLKYCSYLGTNATGGPGVGGIAVDAASPPNIYIAGFTSNSVNGFPVQHALQSVYGGGATDGFLMKLSPLSQGANDLVYATLLGGSGADEALAVAVDSASTPNAYVTGSTGSADFPISGATAAYQASLHASASSNAFLVVVSQDAISGQTSLAYATYLGGSVADAGQGLAVAAPNAVYIAGATTSPDFPWHDNLQPFNGAGDAFVAKIDPTTPGAASLIYATPLGGTSPAGGSAVAAANAVAADDAGHVYVAGATTSGSFPTAVTTENPVNGFQQSCASCLELPPVGDAFVAEIQESSAKLPSVYFSAETAGRLTFSGAGAGVPEFAVLLNGGEAPLLISGIAITGSNAGDFSVSGQNCVGQAISPGNPQGCSFEVTFTPSQGGPEAAAVSFTDNAPGSPQLLELAGAGTAALAAISSTSVNFVSQPENSASNSQTITVSNVGGQPLSFSNLNVNGPDVAQFDPVGGSCGSNVVVAAGGSCTLEIEFAPKATGSFQAEVDFFDNSGNSANAEQVVTLSGTGTPPAPVASISSGFLGFASEPVGSSSGARSVTLTNEGSAALSLANISMTGADSQDFPIAASGTTCPIGGGTLAIGASCMVAVQFAAQAEGTRNATLNFTDNAAGSPQQVALNGTGTATVAPANLVVSPNSLTFAPQSVGSSVNDSQAVTVTNKGGTSGAIGNVGISGANQSDFIVAGNTCTTLGAGGSCQISVSFQPTAVGARSATLNISGANPAAVALSGSATQASISVPTGINFGSQLASDPGTPQPIVVTNSSSGQYAGALTITSVSKSGANAGDFVISTDSCTGTSVLPGGTCSISVAFQPASMCPTMSGPRSATLSLMDNAPGSPHAIPLSGAAVDFCFNVTPGQGISEPITAGQSETYMLEVASSDPSGGSAQLSCSVPSAMLGGCTITTTPATNPPVVQITPANPGIFQLVVSSTPTGSGLLAGRKTPNAPWIPTMALVGWLAMLGAVALLICTASEGSRWRGMRSPGRDSLVATAQTFALLIALGVGMAACGGGGAAAPADPPPGSPPGTYTVTVSATITVTGQPNLTRTFPVTVTID